jgi:U3 small nucleolar RNA-associated protein 16
LHRQAASQKRKRQERDALFKKQADERKQLEEEAKRQAAASGENEDEDAQLDASSKRRRTGKAQIPNILPAEFLDSSSEDEDEDDSELVPARPKKRKVTTIEKTLARQDRGPRDERVGSTVYRVAKKADERMAPKLQKHAKTSKDLLLKRNRSAAQSRSGFLVGK